MDMTDPTPNSSQHDLHSSGSFGPLCGTMSPRQFGDKSHDSRGGRLEPGMRHKRGGLVCIVEEMYTNDSGETRMRPLKIWGKGKGSYHCGKKPQYKNPRRYDDNRIPSKREKAYLANLPFKLLERIEYRTKRLLGQAA